MGAPFDDDAIYRFGLRETPWLSKIAQDLAATDASRPGIVMRDAAPRGDSAGNAAAAPAIANAIRFSGLNTPDSKRFGVAQTRAGEP